MRAIKFKSTILPEDGRALPWTASAIWCRVVEPDPANPSTGRYVTTYAYDIWNNLKSVTMPRPTGTQTRTFTYSGSYLTSATNPENGTVNYGYNSFGKIASKTDAKGQVVVYSYDSYARLTQVQRYPTGISNGEDTCQHENYYYDTNPFASTFSQYAAGRLTAVQYYGPTVPNTASNAAPYANNSGNCATTFTEMYSYSQPGSKAAKRLRVTRNYGSTSSVDLDSTYGYDNEGRMTSEQYPLSGPSLTYAFDSMGRLYSGAGVQSATYGPSNELLSLSGAYSESRTYNAMLQLTQLTVTPNTLQPTVNITYAYSSSQNNGKITSQTDNISGEQVVYTYDALNRLATAGATSWGQRYAYDGFGNLSDQYTTAGSVPEYHVVFDPTTNRVSGDCADANGNEGACFANGNYNYDVENRLVGTRLYYHPFVYAYAPGNKRVWKGYYDSNGNLTSDEVTFWSASGQKLGTYQLVGGSTLTANQTGTWSYFGGKMIANPSGYVGADRLGSIGKYYPYGQERPSATTNGTEKFTGYLRDAETGLDYAGNRYHQPGTGRFLTPDPYTASAGPSNPGSWNRYAYVGGDPIKYIDPSGQGECDPDEECFIEPGGGGGEGCDPCDPTCTEFMAGPCFIEPIGVGGGGGGGSADVCPISPGKVFNYDCLHRSGTDWNQLKVDLKGLSKALLDDSECLTFLSKAIGKKNLTRQLKGNQLSQYFGIADQIETSPGVSAGQVATTNDIPSYAGIIIDKSIYFTYTTYGNDGRYETLLHELAHEFQVPGFEHDGNNPGLVQSNDDQIVANCSKTIGGRQNGK
jgi:RHS repeat-associated protein